MTATPVELTASSSVLSRGGRELIRLDRQRTGLQPELVAAALDELLPAEADDGFRFGYLLGVQDQRRHPAARAVADRLLREVADPVGHCRGGSFSLSFLKASEGDAPEEAEGPLFAGYHLDTHPDLVADGGPELLRVLVNLAPQPRALRFVCADRFELAAGGARTERADYQVVDPPDRFEEDVVEIPPFAGGEIAYLTFWASLVPHVGIERPGGHFLASFEATLPA